MIVRYLKHGRIQWKVNNLTLKEKEIVFIVYIPICKY